MLINSMQRLRSGRKIFNKLLLKIPERYSKVKGVIDLTLTSPVRRVSGTIAEHHARAVMFL